MGPVGKKPTGPVPTTPRTSDIPTSSSRDSREGSPPGARTELIGCLGRRLRCGLATNRATSAPVPIRRSWPISARNRGRVTRATATTTSAVSLPSVPTTPLERARFSRCSRLAHFGPGGSRFAAVRRHCPILPPPWFAGCVPLGQSLSEQRRHDRGGGRVGLDDETTSAEPGTEAER